MDTQMVAMGQIAMEMRRITTNGERLRASTGPVDTEAFTILNSLCPQSPSSSLTHHKVHFNAEAQRTRSTDSGFSRRGGEMSMRMTQAGAETEACVVKTQGFMVVAREASRSKVSWTTYMRIGTSLPETIAYLCMLPYN